MSKRGKALGGKDKGIYRKQLKDGTVKYTVLIKFTKTNGKPGYKTQTAASLKDARVIRDKGRAKRALGHYQTGIVSNPTLADMIKLMLAKKAGNRSIANARAGLKEIGDFFGWQTNLKQINEVRIQAFREHLDTRPRRDGKPGVLTPRSKNLILIELNHLLNVAAKKRFIYDAPEVTRYRDNGRREYNLSIENFWRLYHAFKPAPAPYRAILLMGLFTGQRRGDLMSMKKAQVKGGLIRFKSSKTGKDFTIQCPDILQTALDKLPESDGPYLFPRPDDPTKPRDRIDHALKNACKRAGLKHITLHMVRHLAADELMKMTGNVFFVQQYIGWSSVKMVERYTHVETWTAPIVKSFEQRILQEADKHRSEKPDLRCTQVEPNLKPKSPNIAEMFLNPDTTTALAGVKCRQPGQ